MIAGIIYFFNIVICSVISNFIYIGFYVLMILGPGIVIIAIWIIIKMTIVNIFRFYTPKIRGIIIRIRESVVCAMIPC